MVAFVFSRSFRSHVGGTIRPFDGVIRIPVQTTIDPGEKPLEPGIYIGDLTGSFGIQAERLAWFVTVLERIVDWSETNPVGTLTDHARKTLRDFTARLRGLTPGTVIGPRASRRFLDALDALEPHLFSALETVDLSTGSPELSEPAHGTATTRFIAAFRQWKYALEDAGNPGTGLIKLE